MTPKRTRPAPEPALLDKVQAAKYLGCGFTYFQEHVRKLLPVVDIADPSAKKPMPRWSRADLDAFIASRRRDSAA